MEDKNLPDVGFEGKKKEKKGFIPWLRQKLGLGGPSASGAAGEGAGMMNIGRGIGAAGGRGAGAFGSGGGLLGRGGGLFGRGGLFGPGGLLAGKAGMLATMAMVAAIIGGVMYTRYAQSPSDMAASSVGAGYKGGGSDYIPAIQRAGSNASSLDMFKEANKGYWADEEKAAEDGNKDEETPSEEAPPAEETPAPEAGGDMAAKLQGFNATSLTTGLGGNSGNLPFGSKFGQGAFGPKVDFSGVGSGFANLPKYADRKNKILAMNQNKKAVRGKSSAGKRGAYGKKALSQAKGVKDTQQQYTATGIEGLRGTQDQAWVGQTGDGTADGGAGLGAGEISEGGGGMATTPSIDNTSSPPDTGDGGDDGDPCVTDPDSCTDSEIDNPWGDLCNQSMMYLMLSAALAYAGSKIVKYGMELIKKGWPAMILGIILLIAGIMMCLAALYMCYKVIANGSELYGKHGQHMLGTIYIIGGIIGMVGAIMAIILGLGGGEGWGVTQTMMNWTLGISAIMGLLASMAGGSGSSGSGS